MVAQETTNNSKLKEGKNEIKKFEEGATKLNPCLSLLCNLMSPLYRKKSLCTNADRSNSQTEWDREYLLNGGEARLHRVGGYEER